QGGERQGSGVARTVKEEKYGGSSRSLANLFAGRAAGAGQRRLEVGLRDRFPGLLSAFPLLEVRLAGELPARAHSFLGRPGRLGGELQLLFLDQGRSQAPLVSTQPEKTRRVSNPPAHRAPGLAGLRPALAS